MAFYAGAWLDIFGRKRIMYIYCFTVIIDYCGLLLNAVFIHWPLELLIPMTMTKNLIGKNIWDNNDHYLQIEL